MSPFRALVLSALSACLLVAHPTLGQKQLKSVLMLAVDDLRTQLSVYPEGGVYMQTPNIERIARNSVVFERAYVQVALCMPSRTSILTSRRADTSRSWTIEPDQWFRLSAGRNWTTLPGAFKAKGYLTLGMGKIFHDGTPINDPQDARVSWSEEAFYPDGGQDSHGGLFNPKGKGGTLGGKGKLAHGFSDEDEGALQDGNITNHAVGTIQKMANGTYGADVAAGTRPFFLAIGLHKPHLPWWAPKRFWDLYPIEGVPPVPHPHLPSGVPNVALKDGQIRTFCAKASDIQPFCGPNGEAPLSPQFPLDNTTVPADGAAYMRQAYFASVSWMDHNIGRILDAFEAAPTLSNNTVVVLWGDHGWQLGDNNQWDKMTNFEQALKIPLMINCGGKGTCVGRSSALVEAIDIMPTILEEAGIPIEPCPTSASTSRSTNLCSEGKSLSQLLRNPVGYEDLNPDHAEPFSAAYSQFPRPEHPDRLIDLQCRAANLTQACMTGSCTGEGECPNKMGYTIRTDEYRYTAWVGFNKCQNASCPALLANWDVLFGVELYNHSGSPVPASYGVETENIADLPSSMDVQQALHARLKAFNTKGAS